MKAFLVLLALLYFAPATATAETSVPETFREFVAAKQQQTPADSRSPRSPVEQPEDWIAIAGIVCYAIIPVVLVVGLGFLAYELWTRNADAALLFSSHDAWIFHGGGPPRGLVLLSF